MRTEIKVSFEFCWHWKVIVDSMAQNKEIRKKHYSARGGFVPLCSCVRHYLTKTKRAVSQQMLSCLALFLQKQSGFRSTACYVLTTQTFVMKLNVVVFHREQCRRPAQGILLYHIHPEWRVMYALSLCFFSVFVWSLGWGLIWFRFLETCKQCVTPCESEFPSLTCPWTIHYLHDCHMF